MATESFDMVLEINTDEEAENFIKAMDAADARGRLKFKDTSEALRRGEEIVKRGLRV